MNPARSQLAALLSARLFDDASMYPPSNLPLPDAVRAHLQHRRAGYRACVGPFVCGEASLPDVSAAIASDALAVSVVSRSVAGLSVAEDTARRLPGITLASLEVVLGSNTIGDGLRRSDPARLPIYVEVAVSDVTTRLAQELKAAGLMLKLRTGGTSAAAYPSERDLAAALAVCVAQRLPFKCTAGLHHAVRHKDPGTGFEQHGFLNVIAAVAGAADGPAATAAVLAQREGPALVEALAGLPTAEVAAARDLFRSFGTCSISEPLADLAALGLGESMTRQPARHR